MARSIYIETGKFYHVFNRGVEKRDIFVDKWDYVRFITSMREFNSNKPVGSLHLKEFLHRKAESGGEFGGPTPNALGVGPLNDAPEVEFIVYALLPNHYHFILKQLEDDGISDFMKKIGCGYTGYFNAKHNRTGALFQGRFKAVEITTDEQLLYTSAYIHGNPQIHGLADAVSYQWSSYADYLSKRGGTICSKDYILGQFSGVNSYRDYVDVVIREGGKRKEEVKNFEFNKE